MSYVARFSTELLLKLLLLASLSLLILTTGQLMLLSSRQLLHPPSFEMATVIGAEPSLNPESLLMR